MNTIAISTPNFRPARRSSASLVAALVVASLSTLLVAPSSAWAQYSRGSSGPVSRAFMRTGSGVQSVTGRVGGLLQRHGQALHTASGNSHPTRGLGLVRVGNAITNRGNRVGNGIRTTPGRFASSVHNAGQRVANRVSNTALGLRARTNAATLGARQRVARAVGGRIDEAQAGRTYEGRTSTFRGAGGETRTQQTTFVSNANGRLAPAQTDTVLTNTQGRVTSFRMANHATGRTTQLDNGPNGTVRVSSRVTP